MITFRDFNLSPKIIQALDSLGITQPTEIQEKAIPVLLNSELIDLHGQAQTGTGKTLAFGIPILQTIDLSVKKPQALIVAPTRELVVQICQSLQQAAQYMNISIQPIYGGVSMPAQLAALRSGAHIIVGTPGRLNDHLRRKTLQLDHLKTLVLDEADIMLDMGFRQEVDEILTFAPTKRQIWLFSATVKPGIADLMKTHMKDPQSIRVSKQQVGTTNVEQYYCVMPMRNRMQALCRFIDNEPQFYGFIFCPTKLMTAEVAEQLNAFGYKASALHGDMNQVQRNRVIKQFKSKDYTILVATDVAARGIDIPDITHVINYNFPEDHESYVHRVGRTGRAGKNGVAITFISQSEQYLLSFLKRKFNLVLQPISVPSFETIKQHYIDKAANYLTAQATAQANTELHQTLFNLVQSYPQEALVQLITNHVYEKFFKHIHTKSDFATDTHNNNEMQQELAFNIGFDHGITKQDVIDYLVNNNGISKNTLKRIKVINKRTFIVVDQKNVDTVSKQLQGKSLAGKTINLTVSAYQQKDFQRSNPSRSRRY